MRKKLLVLAAPFDYYQGGSRVPIQDSREVFRRAFDVSYLFRHPVSPREPHFITYDYLLRKRYRDYLFTDAWTIQRKLRQISPDVVYKRGINYITAVGIYYCQRNNRMSVLHIASQRDLDLSLWGMKRGSVRQALYSKIAQYSIRNADRIVCQSEDQRVLLERNFGRKCDLVSPNIHPLPESEHHSKTDPIKVVWVGNIKPLKKPEIFLDLAKEFAQEANVRFVMIGRQGIGKHHANFMARLEQQKNVDYLGELPIDEVNRTLSESHVFVNTSDYEGFPNTFIQAWMREVPVVSLNVDPAGLLANHHLGFYSGSQKKLKHDVAVLLRDHRTREEIGRRARSIAEDRFGELNGKNLVQSLTKWDSDRRPT